MLILPFLASAQEKANISFVGVDCFGDSLKYRFPTPVTINLDHPVTGEEIAAYCQSIDSIAFTGLINELSGFRQVHQLDDWLYYQLVRRVAEQIVPKNRDYFLYTIFKWYVLSRSGYDAILTFSENKLLFYVRSNENIYNIPIHKEGENTYVCLNYHDYGFNIDFKSETFRKLPLPVSPGAHAFTYTVTNIPKERTGTIERDINFVYNQTDYHFRIKLNKTVVNYFRNYPSTDYEKHFNIPLSPETYSSLIPAIRKKLKGVSPKDGVEFLMHFTRYSFLFKTDTEKYGMDKIYSPEMTLFSESSDCEDRVSLFYYLVKELYDLPMIIVVYPKHVSIAVHFDKAFGQTIEYKGKKFTICEPTPQSTELGIGQSIPSLAGAPYEIAFTYEPIRPKIR